MALHGLENSIFVKMSVSPKLIDRYNKIPVKCFGVFFGNWKSDSKFLWNAHNQTLWRQFSVRTVKLTDVHYQLSRHKE